MTDPKKKSDDSKPVQNSPQTPAQSSPTPAPSAVPSNQQDEVKAALARTTQDGKGDDEVPPSDFKSFATDNVELAPIDVVANEVLNGRWGDPKESRVLLADAGYDPREVQREVNRRLAGGAPSAFKLSVKDIASQAIAGLWGSEAETPRNIESAGYDYNQVKLEIKRQLGG